MPLHYVDTSALAKRYLPEEGSDWVNALFSTGPLAISNLAVVELASALARRTREGDLTAETRDAIFRTFLADIERLVVLELGAEVMQHATTMILGAPRSIRLLSLDALHLATARVAFAKAQRRGVAVGSFVTADTGLAAAASWAGLTPLTPER